MDIEIEIGATWARKSDGVLVRVDAVTETLDGYGAQIGPSVHVERLDGGGGYWHRPTFLSDFTSIRTTFEEDFVAIYMPTREEIEAVRVGDVAPYVLGRGEVAEITHRGEDINGRLFVCFYVRTGPGPTSQMSASLKEGEIHSSLAVRNRYTSAEIDALDRRMRAERGDTKKSFRD